MECFIIILQRRNGCCVIEENEFVCNKCTRDMRVPLELINSNAERKQLRPYGYPHGFVYGLVAEFLTGYFTYSREGYETHLKDGEIVNLRRLKSPQKKKCIYSADNSTGTEAWGPFHTQVRSVQFRHPLPKS